MPSPRGISLLDIIGLPPGSTSIIPDDIRTELEKLSILECQTSSSPAAHIYFGTIRSLGDAFFPSSLNWPIELPLLNAGVPFQLTRQRNAPNPGQNLEPASTNVQIDLFLNRVSIVVPGLRPAKLIEGSGVTPAHLDPDPAHTQVRITGTGTLRIQLNGGGPAIQFVAPPDPFNPNAPTGAVFTVGFDPPHFVRRRHGAASRSRKPRSSSLQTHRWWEMSVRACATYCSVLRWGCRARYGSSSGKPQSIRARSISSRGSRNNTEAHLGQRFRRAMIGGRLGLNPNLVPNDPAELVDCLRLLLNRCLRSPLFLPSLYGAGPL